MFKIYPHDEGAIFNIVLQPRSSFSQICGVQGEALKIKVSAPPLEGKANSECIKYLSRVFHISQSKVKIVSGTTSRRKRICIAGISPRQAAQILEEHLL